MAEEEDKSSKTEEPTERKLQKAREKGSVPKSREVNTFFMLLGMAIAVLLSMPYAVGSLLDFTGGIFSGVGTMRVDDTASIGGAMHMATEEFIWILIPTFALFIFFALFGSFIQNGFVWSVEPLKPKLSKVSLIKGFERLFSAKSMVEFLKSLVKMVVLGAALWLVLAFHFEDFMHLSEMPIMAMVDLAQVTTLQMIIAVLFIAGLLAAMDFIFQKQQHTKENRMTRKELKDEFKDTEGDPHVKSRQRQIRMDRARARMMQELPSADVVVTNPTHYAVALRYDKEKEAAPRVVAKGVDHLAMRIRGIAEENDIPFYEDPPLARQLYKEAQIDEEIPLELYETVAKVVAYIYSLKKAV